MAKPNPKQAPRVTFNRPSEIDGFGNNGLDDELGFDISVVEGAIVISPQPGVVHTVLFKTEALMLAALLKTLAERLPELSAAPHARNTPGSRDNGSSPSSRSSTRH